MILLDVNILVHAHREDTPEHARIREWLENRLATDAVFGLADLACSGFLRIVTHHRVFDPPSRIEDALIFLAQLRTQPNCRIISPGNRHWEIFIHLCTQTQASGNLIPDAYLAALAIETDCEWISLDRDFARFPGLRWRNPIS